MKQKFIEWFTKNNNGCSPAMEDDRSFVREKTQHMFEAYQAGVAEGEARCTALAAELNEIKVAVMARMKLHEEIRNAGRPPHTDFWHQSIYMADKRVDDSLASTPNHDAFLAEVRAQGVEMLAAVLRRKGDDAFFDAIAEAQANAADQFADQLRQEAAQ